MIDEPPRKPNGKTFFLIPINPKHPNWLKYATETIDAVVAQTKEGGLQMRGVGVNSAGDLDPHSFMAIKASVLGTTAFLFHTIEWVRQPRVRNDKEKAVFVLQRFYDFAGRVAGGSGILVGDPEALELLAAEAEQIWPPKEAGGCCLIRIAVSPHDKVTGVSRLTDPSANPQRMFPFA
jgi:hypothetical protein